MSDELKIGKYTFRSRLITGSGKYRNFDDMVRALDESGCEMVTVAIGRVNLNSPNEKTLLDYVDRNRYTILPNTAGAYNTEDALRIARLGRAAGMGDLVKLEVIGDKKTLLPDVISLLEATKELVQEGFTVMPYTT